MNPISSDIFGRLDWLTKRIKGLFGAVGLIKTDIANLQTNKLSSVVTDGVSLKGIGTGAQPLSADMSVEYILYNGSTIPLTGNLNTFFFINNDSAIGPGDIMLPDVTPGRRLIVINMTGFTLTNTGPTISDIDNNAGGQLLATSRLHEFIGYDGKWMLVRFQDL